MGSIAAKIRATLIVMTVVNLIACSIRRSDFVSPPTNAIHEYTNTDVNYTFTVPVGYAHETDDEEGMYFGYADTSVYGHFYVQSYEKINLSCTPSLTGVSESTALPGTNGKTSWGKLNKYQWRIDKTYPNALCIVPMQGCTKTELWSGEGCQHGQGAYALCSEKDGKVVVICISQITDNSDLAKQIFSTFHWTE